jgi:D-threo-aldose 1-dehydrogenase
MKADSRIGESDLMVTQLGLGTGMLGAVHDDEIWEATVSAAWEAGVRFFDTSPFYGFGNSEIRIGKLLSGHDPSGYVLGTKVGRLLRLDAEVEYFAATTYYPELGGKMPADVPRGRYDYTRLGTLQSLLETTWRLGRSHLDVVYIHDILELSSGINHTRTAIEEAYPALAEQKEAGMIKAVGVGVQDLDVMVDMVSACDLDVVLLAGRYTLLDQTSLDRALPLCVERGVSVVAGSPYNTGLLHDPAPDKTFDFVKAPPEMLERAVALKKVCEKHDVPLPAAAIQFPLAHPAVAAVLTGACAPSEVVENVELFNLEIPEALWHELADSGLLHPESPLPCEVS